MHRSAGHGLRCPAPPDHSTEMPWHMHEICMVGAHTGCLPKKLLCPQQQHKCWVGSVLTQLLLPLPMHDAQWCSTPPCWLLMAAAHLRGRCSAERAPPAQWAGVCHGHDPSTVDCPALTGPLGGLHACGHMLRSVWTQCGQRGVLPQHNHQKGMQQEQGHFLQLGCQQNCVSNAV